MNIVYRNKIKETIDNIDTITYHITDKNFKCYNDITYQRAIDIIEGPDMCRSEFTKKIKGLFNYGAGSQSIYSINFWIYRGWTLEESNLKVSDIQKNNSNKYVDKLKNGQIQRKQIPKKCDTLEKQQPSYDTGSLKYNITKYGEIEGVTKYKEISYKKGKSTRIEYYLEQGYSEDESKKLLSERQATFSLEKCINKHGKEEGTRIFNERQEKWLNTLNSKPQEEIDDINSRKAITLDNMIRKWGEDGYKKYYTWSDLKNPGILNKNDITMPGKLYYIHFYNHELEFWKIGITKLDVENGRFAKNDVFFNKYNLNYNIIFINEYESYSECFQKEQFILQTFRKNRLNINYNGFKTTEAFNINILKEFIK